MDAIPGRYDGQGRPFDFIVCCTKNIPDIIPTLCDIVAPAVTPGHTAIVLIQNGINIERPFIHRFPNNVIVSGISRIDAHEVAPGVIEQKQNDLLRIGAFNNPSLYSNVQEAAAKRFVEIYSKGGKITCLYRPDVDSDRWSKLVYNASFNPVCALTRLNTGELQKTGRVMDTLVVPAMKEVLAVAKKAGHGLPESIISDTIMTTPINESITPSMQIDLEKVRHLLTVNSSTESDMKRFRVILLNTRISLGRWSGKDKVEEWLHQFYLLCMNCAAQCSGSSRRIEIASRTNGSFLCSNQYSSPRFSLIYKAHGVQMIGFSLTDACQGTFFLPYCHQQASRSRKVG